MNKIYRIEGSSTPGPDYKCSKCGKHGLRLWRQTAIILDDINLLCSICATKNQKNIIKEYTSFHNKHSSSIGVLVPARPTSDDSTFWGHTSGDVLWWYALPQYDDLNTELAQVRLERDHQLFLHQNSLMETLELYQRIRYLENDLKSLRLRGVG